MAMENKFLDVKKSEEEKTVLFWQQFGWSLKSSQQIYNKNSHLESRGDEIWSVTETVDFIKLVLERDKNMPHYQKIVSLENEYFGIVDSLPKESPKRLDNPADMESWAVKKKPDVRYGIKKTGGLIGGIVGVVVAGISGSIDPITPLLIVLFVFGLALVVAALIFRIITKREALKMALASEDTQNRAILIRKYEEANAAYEQAEKVYAYYCKKKDRMPAIITELQALL